MSTRVLEAERQRPYEKAEACASVEAWLRRALSEEYGPIAHEAIPGSLLRLLPQD